MRGKKQWLARLRADLDAALAHRQQLRDISRRHHVQHKWVVRMSNSRTFGDLENAKRLLDQAQIEWRERPGPMGTVILFLRTGDALITRNGKIFGHREQTHAEMFAVWV